MSDFPKSPLPSSSKGASMDTLDSVLSLISYVKGDNDPDEIDNAKTELAKILYAINKEKLLIEPNNGLFLRSINA